ncbi:hypothetical protein GY45DRAFT_1332100 [Cubamyces sp. BRFM 1775]|nr:hypothetical protein GY45DRAFT_1332100 [Cubamyces sp. BRFM 1775]
MPSRSKKQSTTIVVRPIIPGTRQVTKTVLGRLDELNHHAPLEELDPVDFEYYKNVKPWKQQSRSHKSQSPRRNPGRDDGKTYVSRRFVCGTAIGSTRDARGDAAASQADDEDWKRKSTVVNGGDIGVERRKHSAREVRIVDIAKPMKPRRKGRGVSGDFEIVNAVGRVVALEDESDRWPTSGLELDGWDMLEEWDSQQTSYATVLQRSLST